MDKEETRRWKQKLFEATAVTAIFHVQMGIMDMRDRLCGLLVHGPITWQNLSDTANELCSKNSEKWSKLVLGEGD